MTFFPPDGTAFADKRRIWILSKIEAGHIELELTEVRFAFSIQQRPGSNQGARFPAPS